MHFSLSNSLYLVSIAATVFAAPALHQRENLCNLKAPPSLCTPNSTVTLEEMALRAYRFYRAFVVDGDPRVMFSLIDSTYKQHRPGYTDGPNTIWPLFCNGKPVGKLESSDWCFLPQTNMSYASYGTVDRWRWVGGCVHEHWDTNETMPKSGCYKLVGTLGY